jgi:hypothetical protein
LDTSQLSNNLILQAAAFLVFANGCSQLDSFSLFNFFQTDFGIIISQRTEISIFSLSFGGIFLIVFTFIVISSHTSQSQRVIA